MQQRQNNLGNIFSFPNVLILTGAHICILFLSSNAYLIGNQNEEIKNPDVHENIVNGALASNGEFPYQVALSFIPTNSQFCGGSILTSRIILTAAHCLTDDTANPNHLKVTAGTTHLRSLTHAQVRSVKTFYNYENYDPRTKLNDIAIIVLNEPLQYTSSVQNISLPRKDEQFEGYTTVSGWGKTAYKGQQSTSLLKITVPIVTHQICQDHYSDALPIRHSQFCAGSPGVDPCQGDSGGPATCTRGGASNTRLLCGVVSLGRACGIAGTPAVYTKVSSYIDWIKEIIRMVEAPIISGCEAEKFQCGNGNCIPLQYKCDKDNDCGDNSDEISCPSICKNNEFRCGNEKCIPLNYRCDKDNDCGDGSDEFGCRHGDVQRISSVGSRYGGGSYFRYNFTVSSRGNTLTRSSSTEAQDMRLENFPSTGNQFLSAFNRFINF